MTDINRQFERRGGALTRLMLCTAFLTLAACGADDDERLEADALYEDTDSPEIEQPERRDRAQAADESTDSLSSMRADERETDRRTDIEDRLTKMASAEISPASGSDVSGEVTFRQVGDFVRIEGTLNGLEQGEHGLHIHTRGDCSAKDASSAGGHFAPYGNPHGAPDDINPEHHTGDLGNIAADESGSATFSMSDTEMTLESGETSIVGRAVIVHSNADDFESQPSGDAGNRVGCGVIELDDEQDRQVASTTKDERELDRD